MKKHFSNSEIFDFFKNNKRLLLTLFQEKIIIVDQLIFTVITRDKFLKKKYPKYFFPEIKPFITDKDLLEKAEANISSNFEEKRKIGEDDCEICELIRKDLIEEFIIYVKKTNYPLKTTIETSFFETNSLLLKNDPTLIEYSAFFGSVQVFKYLYLNGIELTSSLWLFAVHGQNDEIIHLLQENKIEPDDKSYLEIFKESIKCHHNDFTYFIEKNFLNDNFELIFDENVFDYCFHYYNYKFLPMNLDHKYVFYYICQYGFLNLVRFYLNTKEINLNETIVITY